MVLVVLMVFTLGSCTVYRTINFNADQSGTIENRVDMSSFMAMMNENGGGANSMGSMGDLGELDKTKADLESIDGISNVIVSYDTAGIMTTSYSFKNINALNKALGSGYSSEAMILGGAGQEDSKPASTIKYKGKKFTWTEIDQKMIKKLQSNEGKQEMAEMDMMLASSKMNTNITFPTAVKKVSYKNAVITNDNTVSFVMSIKEFISKDYKPLVISLK